MAADRREGTRHVPRNARTPTVGQLEDAEATRVAAPDTDPGGQTPDPGVRE